MIQVHEVLRLKGNVIFSVDPLMPVQQAVEMMAEKDIGSVLVIEHEELVGILTFREIMQRVAESKGVLGDTIVRTIMDDAPMTVSPNTEINEVQRLMLERHARYIPVLDGRQILGVISFYDVARSVLEAQKFENQMLKAYIRDWSEEEKPDNQ